MTPDQVQPWKPIGAPNGDAQQRLGAVKAEDVFSSSVADRQASALKEKSTALPELEKSTETTRSSLTALKIYSNEYDRGAIVKLAEDHSHPAVAKYIVKRDHGKYHLLDANGHKPRRTATYSSLAQATGQAIRECERIRDHLTGGGDVRSEG